jgi:hypothetical protein
MRRNPQPAAPWAAAIALILVFAAPVRPADAGLDNPTPEGLQYLMEEPVSLLDLGFYRVQRDIDQAAASLVDPDYRDIPPRSGVFYSWRRDTIEAFVRFPVAVERRTAAACLDRFLTMTRALLGGAPDGPERARGYLSRVFAHAGPRRWYSPPPRSFSEDLENAFTF